MSAPSSWDGGNDTAPEAPATNTGVQCAPGELDCITTYTVDSQVALT